MTTKTDPFNPAVETFATSASRIPLDQVPESVIKLVRQAYESQVGVKATFASADIADRFCRFARAYASQIEPRLTFRTIVAHEDDSEGTVRFAVTDFRPRGRAAKAKVSTEA